MNRLSGHLTDPQVALLVVVLMASLPIAAAFLFRLPLRYVEVMLIGVVAVPLLWLGIYHFSHKGVPSGIIEMASFSLLATAAILAARRMHD